MQSSWKPPHEQAAPQGRGETFGVTTFNGNCWNTLVKFLKGSDSDVVLAQEIGLEGEALTKAVDAAKRMGWKMVAAPSQQRKGGQHSAGVAVLAREHVGLRFPDGDMDPIASESRALHVVVDIEGWPPVHVFSMYLHVSEHLSRRNIDIMAKVGARAKTLEHFIIGGDWNMWPSMVELSGMTRSTLGSIAAPTSGIPTCDTGEATSCIDFFMLSDSVGKLLAGDKVDTAWAPSPHRPYAIQLKRDAGQAKQLVFRAPPGLARERVIGPLVQGPAWDLPLGLATKALVDARGDDLLAAKASLDLAWKHFANHAEMEVMAATDQATIKKGLRAAVPRTIFADIKRSKRRLEDFEAIREGWKWLAAAGRTARRIAKPPSKANADNKLLGTHCEAIAASAYPGAGLLSRLDRAADSLKASFRSLPQGSCPEGSTGEANAWLTEALGIFDTIELEDQESEKEHTGGQAAFWAAWREEAFAKGGRGMHRATRLKEGWAPTVVKDDQGALTSAPEVILQRQSEELGRFWHSEAWAMPAWAPGSREALPAATPREIRAVARTYPVATAATIDGFHPRHFNMISDQGLLALSGIFTAVELLGMWPAHLACIMVQLIDKPKGGFRPICLFAAAVRVWERMRRPLCQDWCARCARPYWAFTAGAGAELTVWRQVARVEANSADKSLVTAGSLRDMRKFYESVDLEVLKERFCKTGFPEPIARVLINLWRGPRAIKMLTTVHWRKHYARSGLPAGSSFADLAVIAYCIEQYDGLVDRWPRVTLSVYVDDQQISSTGTRKQVIADVVGATEDLEDIVKEEFKASFAADKSTHVGSDQALADSICKALTAGAGEAATAVENLGCDYQVGDRRAAPRGLRKRAARTKKLTRRVKIIARMRRSTQKGKDRLFGIAKAGARPMASFGCKVMGYSDNELKVLRRRLAATAAPTARGSLSAKLAIIGDPAVAEAIGPASAWAAECWRSTTGDPKSLTGAELAWAWKNAASQEGGWASSRGVARRCILTLGRLGWEMPGPFTFLNEFGEKVSLTKTAPSLVDDMLREANQRSLERQVARKLDVGDDDMARVCCDTVRRVLSPASKKIDALGKSLVRAMACGSYWTRSRMREAGYEVEDVCPLCNSPGDTLHHRLWSCHAGEQQRKEAAGKEDTRLELESMGPDSLIATRGLFRHPADKAERPSTSESIKVVQFGRDQWGQETQQEVPFNEAVIQGDIFPDGAAYPHPVRDLARAGWAAVALDPLGNVLTVVSGAVPAPLPQTPQAAEYAAITYIAPIMQGEINIFPDCMNVVRDFNRPFTEQTNGKRRYAGLLKGAQQHEAWVEAAEAKWQKAHLNLNSLRGEEYRRAKGNDEADKAAKLAAKGLHAHFGDDVDESARKLDKQATATCRVAAAVLRLFPGMHERAGRPPPPHKEVALRPKGGHEWGNFMGGLRCTKCWMTAGARDRGFNRDSAPCKGIPPAMSRVALNDKGHHLVLLRYLRGQGATSNEPAFVICAACGSYAAKCTRKLAQQCPGAKESGRGLYNLRRVAGGRHPRRDTKVDGGQLAQLAWVSLRLQSHERHKMAPARRRGQAPTDQPGSSQETMEAGESGPKKDSVARAIAQPLQVPPPHTASSQPLTRLQAFKMRKLDEFKASGKQ